MGEQPSHPSLCWVGKKQEVWRVICFGGVAHALCRRGLSRKNEWQNKDTSFYFHLILTFLHLWPPQNNIQLIGLFQHFRTNKDIHSHCIVNTISLSVSTLPFACTVYVLVRQGVTTTIIRLLRDIYFCSMLMCHLFQKKFWTPNFIIRRRCRVLSFSGPVIKLADRHCCTSLSST